jgi:hypothetical protein
MAKQSGNLVDGALPLICSLGHFVRIGKWPDLSTPTTFNEKIQHFKLTNRDQSLARYIDKILVKEFVSEKLNEDWVIPTLFSGTELPEKRSWPIPYVVKANNSSGRNAFVRSNSDEDWPDLRVQALRWVRTPHPWITGEWLYRQIEPKILIEPLLGNGRLPADYKFFVFGGAVKAVQVDTGRDGDHRRTFFDRHWSRLKFELRYRSATETIPPPARLESMISAAETLGEPFDFVRVDLYEIDGQPKFGELTFTPGAGVEPFRPRHFDEDLGRHWS